MTEFSPPAFGDTPPPPKKDSTQAWLVSMWLKRRLGVPAELVTPEKVGHVMEAYGVIVAVFEWWMAAKKKQREEEEKKEDAPS